MLGLEEHGRPHPAESGEQHCNRDLGTVITIYTMGCVINRDIGPLNDNYRHS